MDSGESGSMRSSSGGCGGGGDDQEFDSRGGGESSISSFLNPFLTQHHHRQNPNNNSNTTTFFDLHHHHHAQPFPQQSSNATITHYINNNNNNSNNNNDMFWSSGLRSQEPNYGNFGNLTTPSPSPSSLPQQQGPFLGTSPSSVRPRTGPEAHASDQLSNVVKNPKKRNRASRRAPTTVLTTDTSNFRQMVQEFTGIPAGPFSGTPYSRRLDLFSTGLRPTDPLYPLRPSAQKILSPFSSSSPSSAPPTMLNPTMIDSIVPTTNIVSNNNTNNINYPIAPSSARQLLNLQQHHHHHRSTINPLQLGAMNFGSGFAASQVGNDDDHNITRWRSSTSGETVVRDHHHHVDSNNGIRGNENLVTFDGNSINSTASRGDPHHHHHHHHGHISGGGGSSYNLNNNNNNNNNNDDTLETNVGVVSTAAAAEGNVASWICPPAHNNN